MRKHWKAIVLASLITLSVGYVLYMNFLNTKAFYGCIRAQSLDVTRQDAIRDYCREVVINEKRN
jgi:hypothetical protein